MTLDSFTRDVGIIGGCGHVGLPLSLIMADSGYSTVIYDLNVEAVNMVKRGEMPFSEEGAEEILARVLRSGVLEVSDKPDLIKECKYIIVIVGTPLDEHLNPRMDMIHRALNGCIHCLRDGQIMILRSTVFPGITDRIQKYLNARGLDISVAFCPERVAQGQSIREFRSLPQIVSATNPETLDKVKNLFGRFTSEFIEVSTMEAELSKLMTNAWRYLQFATVNQFFMIATEHGLSFDRILHACKYKYPRMAQVPGPGFAAGPCLVKDTMQLAAFSRNSFVLGHAGMLVNEGLPNHLVTLAKRQTDLSTKVTGILGMAFKAESDDNRDSLSYKLKKILTLESERVLCTDPYVKDQELVPVEQVLKEADVIFVCTPHNAYHGLTVPEGKIVVDVWNWVAPGT